MQTRTAAIVLLPPFESIDGPFGQQCLSHIERRGYSLFTVVHDWHAADEILDEGVATVVVFARIAHRDPNCRWPAEYADETTRIARPLPPRLDRRVRERYGTVNVSAAAQEDLPTVAILARRRQQNERAPSRAEDLVEEAARRLGFLPRR